MKKIGFLILVLVFVVLGVVKVDATEYLPYEKDIKQIQLMRYTGTNKEYWIRKITGNTAVIHNILDVIDDKNEVEKEVVKNNKLTNLELSYTTSNKVTIVFYGDNVIGITENNDEEKIYEVNYNGNIEDKIIDLYSFFTVEGENNVSNPSTGDNTLLIISFAIVAAGVAVVAFRKRKLS